MRRWNIYAKNGIRQLLLPKFLDDPLFGTSHSFMTLQMKSSFHLGSAIPEKARHASAGFAANKLTLSGAHS
jgi:hypothetical protein